MKIRIIGFLTLLIAIASCQDNPQRLTDQVNTFIGTGGHGHTYPGAATPFGMVQLSPDTRLEGWDGCGGYHYTDSIVYGFSHTHLSGTGISDYGDVLFMPTSGEIMLDNGYKMSPDKGYASRFSHDKEHAEPGYYEVQLADYDIDVALTVTPRAGFHKYTFNKEGQSNVILDLEHRDVLTDVSFEIVDEQTIKGSRVSKAWAQEQHLYFYAKFSKPFIKDSVSIRKLDDKEVATKAAFTFDLSKGDDLLLKVGISAVDTEGAKKNLETEIPDWDFEGVKESASDTWEKRLSKITVEGGSQDERTIFYTAMYHSLLNPNLYSDVDGRYRGMDMGIHKKEEPQYTVFSLWDTFRATHPLFTIIEQDKTNEFINTFLDQYEKGGILPIWELAGNYTGCMIGYHSIPVITDAYAKGIKGYDVDKAFEAMKYSATRDKLGLDALKAQGYIPADHEHESVSKTLEYAYDDWCIAYMAKQMGREEDAANFFKRGQYYKNIFDPTTGFMRAKMNGSWFKPFDPAEVNFNYTEANSWQYSLFAPQDISGLINLYGGEAAFEKQLDELFETKSDLSGRHQVDITGLIGQYAHGNEPSHHMAYLYNYVGKPWKTQQRIDQIMKTMYTNTPDGLSGNEDCGQMSSWYVLSAVGFYPVTPGLPYYTLGTPVFDKVTINLENGNTFEIVAKGRTSESFYIQSASLNGGDFKASFLNHEDIMKGGTLTFEMGAEANQRWFEKHPVASIDEYKVTPVPFFLTDSKTFTDSLQITLGCADSTAQLFYALHDGKESDLEFKAYEKPVILKDTKHITAYALKGDVKSFEITADYLKVEGGRSITLEAEYANQYAAGGPDALINYLRGGHSYQAGDWQGFQGQDLVATVDLGREKQVKEISMGFLQDIKSWIWYPTEITFEVSNDGENFQILPTIKNDFPDNQYGSFTRDFSVAVNSTIRYIKVTAKNYGECPEWHLGHGGKSWLFADEIVVE